MQLKIWKFKPVWNIFTSFLWDLFISQIVYFSGKHHWNLVFSQPVPLWGGLRQSRNYVCMYVGMFVRCYLLILLQSFQCRGGIISDLCSLCRSQSLGTSHWYYHLLHLPSSFSSSSSSCWNCTVFDCTVLYCTVLYCIITLFLLYLAEDKIRRCGHHILVTIPCPAVLPIYSQKLVNGVDG